VGTAMAVAGAMPMVLAVDASLTQLNAELPTSPAVRKACR
jgi:hypothetical protein